MATKGRDNFISKIVKDPASPPKTILLRGYLGDSSEEGHTRLYTDAQLNHYVEIPDDEILYEVELPKDQSPLGESLVWINQDAEVTHVPAGPQRLKSRFLEGPIAAAAAHGGFGGATPALVMGTPSAQCTGGANCVPPTPLCVGGMGGATPALFMGTPSAQCTGGANCMPPTAMCMPPTPLCVHPTALCHAVPPTPLCVPPTPLCVHPTALCHAAAPTPQCTPQTILCAYPTITAQCAQPATVLCTHPPQCVPPTPLCHPTPVCPPTPYHPCPTPACPPTPYCPVTAINCPVLTAPPGCPLISVHACPSWAGCPSGPACGGPGDPGGGGIHQ